MADDYYEVIAPDRWKNARPYKEFAYKEQIHIKNGKGTCKAASSAAMLRNLGYKTILHTVGEITVKEEPDERQGATDETLTSIEDSDEARSALEGI